MHDECCHCVPTYSCEDGAYQEEERCGREEIPVDALASAIRAKDPMKHRSTGRIESRPL